MSIAPALQSDWPPTALPPYPVRRFSVPEYHRLLETGILGEDDRVELLEGWIVPKMTRTPAHDLAIELIDTALRLVLPVGWRIRIQSAVTTSDSEPEPDVAVVKGPIRGAANRHPAPGEVGLLIEVSESSLDTDRTNKGRIYAHANVPVYWIVNLVDSQIEVYSDPTGPVATAKYRSRQDYQASESVPLVVGGQSVGKIAVSDLLP